jgi:hypothetical protein
MSFMHITFVGNEQNFCSLPVYWLTGSRRRVLLEKLIVTQLVMKLTAFYGT